MNPNEVSKATETAGEIKQREILKQPRLFNIALILGSLSTCAILTPMILFFQKNYSYFFTEHKDQILISINMLNEYNFQLFAIFWAGFITLTPTTWLLVLSEDPVKFFSKENNIPGHSYNPVTWLVISMISPLIFSGVLIRKGVSLTLLIKIINSNVSILIFSLVVSIVCIAIIKHYQKWVKGLHG